MKGPMLTLGPRFNGVPYGEELLARLVIHSSQDPFRSDAKNNSSPSAERLIPSSALALLTTGPRFTGCCQLSFTVGRVVAQRSILPSPPVRFEAKNRDNPSREIRGAWSTLALLIAGPRFTGVPQSSSFISRVVTHRSPLPYPPARRGYGTPHIPSEKNIDSPSDVKVGHPSQAEVLTFGPRLTGAPQSSSLVGRIATHMSTLPCPPDRSLAK